MPIEAVDRGAMHFKNNMLYPWFRRNTRDKCYKKLLDKKDSLHHLLVNKASQFLIVVARPDISSQQEGYHEI